MGGRTQDVWVFRIVHPETGKPVQGVPVTVLDATGNPAGYWVSAADGTVAIPRRDVRKLRLRVGLRSEDPIELATATLGDDPTPLAAPVQLPPAAAAAEGAAPARDPVSGGAPAGASGPAGPPSRPGDQPEVPGHVLYFQRLAMFGEGAAEPADVSGAARGAAADFFALPGEGPAEMRYGVLIEVEQYWQSLGVLWGELLYSVTLTPGDEARLVVLDGRWRRETDGRERPLQILARMVGSSMLGDLVTALRPELQLDPFTLTEPRLDRAALDGRLLEHIQANLLYYSTAIITAGDPAARHAALAKLRDPAGRPLTEVAENTVVGRVGNAVALPLRSAAALPPAWRDALAAYEARPPRVGDSFTVTIPHPGVWVSAQPHAPLQQQQQADAADAAG